MNHFLNNKSRRLFVGLLQICYQNIIIRIIMLQLKLALMKEKVGPQKSKLQKRMWYVDEDLQEEPNNKKDNQPASFLSNKLIDLFKKDKKASTVAFDKIIQQFRQLRGGQKQQILELIELQDKIYELKDEPFGDIKKFFQEFIQYIQNKIEQQRQKEKTNSLLDFQKIVQNNFLKKSKSFEAELLPKPFSPSKAVETVKFKDQFQEKRQNQLQQIDSRQKSSEKVLNKLFAKEKNIKKQKFEQKEQNKNQTHLAQQTNQSVSYSAIMSASCAVRQRNKPRKSNKRKQELQINQSNNQQDQNQKKQRGFVFYRPKKSK